MSDYCEHDSPAAECGQCRRLKRRLNDRALSHARRRADWRAGVAAAIARIFDLSSVRYARLRKRRAFLAAKAARAAGAPAPDAELRVAVTRVRFDPRMAPDALKSDSLILACKCGACAWHTARDLDFAGALRTAVDQGWRNLGASAAGEEHFAVAAMRDARGGVRASVNARCPRCSSSGASTPAPESRR